MTTMREERTELIELLCTLKEQQKASHKPEMYILATRQTKSKLLGLYRQVMNDRKPVDSVVAPTVEVV